MNNKSCLTLLLALCVFALPTLAANNAEECKQEGGVWRESATMGGFCFKKLAADRAAHNPDSGTIDNGKEGSGQQKATIVTSRSNTKGGISSGVDTQDHDSDNDGTVDAEKK